MIGILIDTTRCVGCFECVDVCVAANNLGSNIPAPQHSPDGLSAQRWSTIVQQPAGHYTRKQCRHCLEPACVSACPVGAMQKTANGPVIYDPGLCMGCRYCMMACPYGIPRYHWDSLAPTVRKCNFCYERLQEGGTPACAEGCSHEALLFGERDDLLAEGHRRIAAGLDTYQPQIYGEYEVGGTSVLYVSDVPLDFLRYHGELTNEPLPDLTHAVMSKVPGVAVGMMLAASGLHWIIGRRMKMAAKAETAVEAEQND